MWSIFFGNGGGGVLASQSESQLLGSLPLQRNIRELADVGKPIFAADPFDPTSIIFTTIAKQVSQALAKLPRDYSLPMTNVVIEES